MPWWSSWREATVQAVLLGMGRWVTTDVRTRTREGVETTPTPRFQIPQRWSAQGWDLTPFLTCLEHPGGSQLCHQNSPVGPQSPPLSGCAVHSWCRTALLPASHCKPHPPHLRASPYKSSCTSHLALPLCLLRGILAFESSSGVRSSPPHSAGWISLFSFASAQRFPYSTVSVTGFPAGW